MAESLASYATLLEELAKDERPRLLPRAVRGSAVELHDGDRGLRLAGADAALVVRRALHLPARSSTAWGIRGCSRSCFPGNPGRAYLAGNNSLQENTLVTAHVLGHADFAKNNSLFKRSQEQVGYKNRRAGGRARAPDRPGSGAARANARRAGPRRGARARSAHRHVQALRREPYPQYASNTRSSLRDDPFRSDSTVCPAAGPVGDRRSSASGRRFRPSPERDLLWFIARVRSRARGVGARYLPCRARGSRSISTRCSRARS